MTWMNRLRLFAGVMTVVIVVAAMTLLFNLRQNSTLSQTASVDAALIDVNGAYTGTVVKEYKKDGQSVEVGDKLFTVRSPALVKDLADDLEIKNSGAWTIDAKRGEVTYLATTDGVLDKSRGTVGNALTSSGPFAEIQVRDSEFVSAKLLLTPRDYNRIQNDAAVQLLLPNDQVIDGKVSSISVTTDQGRALASVRIDSDDLADPALANLTKVGTPVTATVTLRDDGPLAGVNDMTFDFLRKIGLK